MTWKTWWLYTTPVSSRILFPSCSTNDWTNRTIVEMRINFRDWLANDGLQLNDYPSNAFLLLQQIRRVSWTCPFSSRAEFTSGRGPTKRTFGWATNRSFPSNFYYQNAQPSSLSFVWCNRINLLETINLLNTEFIGWQPPPGNGACFLDFTPSCSFPTRSHLIVVAGWFNMKGIV